VVVAAFVREPPLAFEPLVAVHVVSESRKPVRGADDEPNVVRERFPDVPDVFVEGGVEREHVLAIRAAVLVVAPQEVVDPVRGGEHADEQVPVVHLDVAGERLRAGVERLAGLLDELCFVLPVAELRVDRQPVVALGEVLPELLG